MSSTTNVHSTAVIEEQVTIAPDARIWHHCHIRTGANIGELVSIGKGCYIDTDVSIDRGSRIQNGVSVYKGVSIDKWCFIGPHVIFTNDQNPRAGTKSWEITPTFLESGSSVGAGSVIRCGVTLGSFCLVGAGAIVTKSIPPFALAFGFPAKVVGRVCACGQTHFYFKKGVKPRKPKTPFAKCCQENLTPEVYKLAEEIFKGTK